MQVKPSTLQSTLCTTNTNSCDSATNRKTAIQSNVDHLINWFSINPTAIQTTHLFRAKRCTNHDRNKLGGNTLDTEDIPKKG